MTNTYIAPGKSTPEEIIAATERGLYVKSIIGGSVESATGDFNFSTGECYLIEKRKSDDSGSRRYIDWKRRNSSAERRYGGRRL